MSKKTITQVIHDVKPPIDAINELTTALYDICQDNPVKNLPELELGIKKLTEMTSTLNLYMKERFNEYADELQQLNKLKETITADYSTIVVLDNDPTITEALRFIARKNNKQLFVSKNTTDFFSKLDQYPQNAAFFLDYALDNAEETGIDVAKKMHELGYQYLYLMSGYHFDPQHVPAYLKILDEKKDILNFVRKKSFQEL